MSFQEIFDFFRKVTSKRKATPTKPRTQAITLEGRGIYLTKMPMVPKMVIARISFARARTTESEEFVGFILDTCFLIVLKVHKAYSNILLERYIYNLLFFEKVYIIPSGKNVQKKG